MSFWAGFEKRAKKKDPDRKLKGGLAAGAGAAALYHSKPLLTGRTDLYHGTTKANAEKIRKEGLKPGGRGISEILEPGLRAKDNVYMTRNPTNARTFAAQAELLKNHKGHVHDFAADPLRDDKLINGTISGKGEVVNASMPLWRKDISEKMVPNPELRGAKNWREFHKSFGGPTGKSPLSSWAAYQNLKDKSFKGGIGPEFIKGSPHYKKPGLREIMQYAKAKPGRFGAGAALAGAGAAGVGYGLHHIFGGEK